MDSTSFVFPMSSNIILTLVYLKIWFINDMASTSRWKSKCVKFYWTAFRNRKQFLIRIQLPTFSCFRMNALISIIRAGFGLSFVRKMTTCLGCNNLSVLISINDILPFSRKTFCFSRKFLFLFVGAEQFSIVNKIVLICSWKRINSIAISKSLFPWFRLSVC